jgi:small GTP-binding protein
MHDYVFKIILVGDTGAGKTAIMESFCYNTFSSSKNSTIGVDLSTETLEVGDKRVKLDIWDTSGQERFSSITTSYFKGSHGVFIVFDAHAEKQDTVSKWVDIIHEYIENVPIVILGNKTDLGCKDYTFDHLYIPVSAKNRTNIEESFQKIVDIMIKTLHDEIFHVVPLNSPIRIEEKKKKKKCCTH